MGIKFEKSTFFRLFHVIILLAAVFNNNLASAQRVAQKKNETEEKSDTFASPNAELASTLLKRHSKKLRPVKMPNETLHINVLAAIYQIVEVNQRTNLVDLSAYFDLWWIDPFLAWNLTEFRDISETYLPADEVWTPDLYLYHSVQGSTPLNVLHSAVRVYNNGTVRVFVPFSAKAFCPINVKYFPFETLTCWFNFGSWSYNENFIKYQVVEVNVSLNDFYDNQEWFLLSASLTNNKTNYNNSRFNEVYSIFTLSISLERGWFYYIFNLIIPSTLVTVVSVIGFHAAANSTERRESKFRLGIMTLLSMGVLLLNVVDNMPKFSMASTPGQRGSFSDVPLLGLYYLSLILIVSFCTCTSSLFVTLESYAIKHPHRIPYFLKWLTFEWPCFRKKCKHGDYSQIEGLKPAHSTEALTSEVQSISNAPNPPPQVNHTQLSQTDFVGTFPPPLKSQKARKGPQSEDVQLMNRNFERLCETCSSVLYEIKQIRLSVQQQQKDSSKAGSTSSRPSTKVSSSQKQQQQQSRLLTPLWDRVICRIECLSLIIYLSLVALSLLMFSKYQWY